MSSRTPTLVRLIADEIVSQTEQHVRASTLLILEDELHQVNATPDEVAAVVRKVVDEHKANRFSVGRVIDDVAIQAAGILKLASRKS